MYFESQEAQGIPNKIDLFLFFFKSDLNQNSL